MSAENFDTVSHASPQLERVDDNYDEMTEIAGEAIEADDADSLSECDETTGASPGTAQACDDLGLSSLASNLKRFNIKPPGQA